MEVQPDFKELLRLFTLRGVEFIIVGAFALAHHGAPRYTGDLDVYVRPDAKNAERVMSALRDFGFGSVGLTTADFSVPARVVQLGYPPVRIDIITSISGLTWEEAASGRAAGSFGDIAVHYIGRDQFIVNKRATGRFKDLADVEALGEIERS